MAGIEAVLEEVGDQLMVLDISQLGECCVQLSVSIPPAKMGKKLAIRSLVLNYLTSLDLDEDDAQEVVRALKVTVDKMLVDEKDVKEKDKEPTAEVVETDEVKHEEKPSTSANKNSNIPPASQPAVVVSQPQQAGTTTTTRVELSRFKDWKVTPGTFGGDNHVDYCSLCFQIEEAQELHYSEREIVSGMIKSMKNPLKKYCETKRTWSLESLMASLRAYVKVKTSEEVMDEMKKYCQQPKQSEIEYLTTMCTYRDNILAMTKQEEHPLDERRVQMNFRRALAVGFKRDTIRLMVAPICKNDKLSDNELMTEINEAVDADTANRNKTKGEKSAASNNLNVEQVGDKSGGNSDEPPPWLRDMVNKMDGICDTVKVLEGRVNSLTSVGGSGDGNTGGGSDNAQPYKFIKCEPCRKEGRYCKHCSLCGQLGH